MMAGALLAAAIAATPAACTAAQPTSPASTDVPFTADCDAHNNPVNVQPNTAQARLEAVRMCAETGSEVANAPWPSGWHPVPGGAVAQR
jgi:hypothetical protein